MINALLSGTVTLTGMAWLGAGIRVHVPAWLAASVVGVGGAIVLTAAFGGALASV